jgi:hypothetical protein
MEEPQDLLELVVWSRKKPGIFFHDAWNEYALVLPERQKFSLTMGADCIITWDYQEPWPQH